MRVLANSDWLYKKDSKGRIRAWKAHAEVKEDGEPYFITMSGVHGRTLATRESLVTGTKMLGAETRAIRKVNQAATKKLKDGYYKTVEEAEAHVETGPMLLHKWEDHEKKIKYPAILQPKLDGICAIFEPAPKPCFKSREGNEFENLSAYAHKIRGYMKTVLEPYLRGSILLHGELYAHGHTVGELVEYIKGGDMKLEGKLKFYVYDYMHKDSAASMTYLERLNIGLKLFTDPPWEKISTKVVTDRDHALAEYKLFIQAGYEGAVICNTDAPYQWGRRTYGKLKMKQTFSKEFTIVNVSAEYDGSTPLAVFTCELKPGGYTFNVRPMGTAKTRAAMYKERDLLLGKLLTVEYRSLTKDGLPFHPVGIAIRDYE